MADYSLTKDAAAIDATLNLIDETVPKNSDTMLASAGVLLNETVTRSSVLHADLAASSTAYGDEGNGVTAGDAAVAIKNAHDLLTGSIGETIYNTGNTGLVTFEGGIPVTEGISLSTSGTGLTVSKRAGVTAKSLYDFYNGNGFVGSIQTSGTSTSFNTSSDNRLKTVLGKPTDAQVSAKFNDIFDSFTLFDWKNGGNSEPVWGFLAHDVEDRGLDFYSPGEGSRDLEIGEVYQDAVLDEDGEIVEHEKVVTPYGVDQSKVVPYLVAKIEQLERRLNTLENK